MSEEAEAAAESPTDQAGWSRDEDSHAQSLGSADAVCERNLARQVGTSVESKLLPACEGPCPTFPLRSNPLESAPRTTRPLLLGLIAVLVLLPVTLPVPVLRGLVRERFEVSVFLTSLFMSVNMIGAFLTAPIIGALSDRTGRRRAWIVNALLLDALCFLAMTQDLPFWAFLALRFVEGCAHIAALSLLLTVASDTARTRSSGVVMGMVGSGITLGVAFGAALGGQLGNEDPLLPLRGAAVVDAITACFVGAFLLEAERGESRPGLGRIVAALKSERGLLVPWLYAFVDRFTVGCFVTAFPLWMSEVHGLEPKRTGLLLAAFLVPFGVLSYPAGRLGERWSRTRMLVYGSAIYGVGLCSLGWWSVPSLPYVMVGLGIVSAVMFVPSLMLTQDLAPPDARSTAMGGFNAAGSIGFVFGPLVVATVIQWLGGNEPDHDAFSGAFAVAGVTEIACALGTFALLRRLVLGGRST